MCAAKVESGALRPEAVADCEGALLMLLPLLRAGSDALTFAALKLPPPPKPLVSPPNPLMTFETSICCIRSELAQL
jgi:hypothetical protein